MQSRLSDLSDTYDLIDELQTDLIGEPLALLLGARNYIVDLAVTEHGKLATRLWLGVYMGV